MLDGTSILVVEDEILVSRDICSRLEKMGYIVVGTSANGTDAVLKAFTLQPQLILMDINLRGDMDGVEAASRIVAEHDIPIIFCTAYSNDETLERAKVMAPYGYLLTPVDNRELEINIEMALYKHQMEQDLRDTRQRLDATLANVNDAVVAADRSGEIYLFNPIAEKLTGWHRDRARGESLFDVIRLSGFADCEALDCHQILDDRGSASAVRQNLERIDGVQLPVEVSINSLASKSDLVVVTFRDIGQQLGFEQRIRKTAFFDELTDLPNRALFTDRLSGSLKRRQRGSDSDFAIVFLGLDGFSVINEGLGHEEGDRVLTDVGQRIRQTVRPDDTVARIGSDIFAVLLDPVDSVRGTIHACDRVQAAISEPIAIGGKSANLAASIGIVLYQGQYQKPEEMIRDAEAVLHRAKRDAKGSYRVFDLEMYRSALRFLEWKSGMEQAIVDGSFEVFYQPIVNIETSQLVSMEALLRWNHPVEGYVSPAEFIPIAEESGLILPLGEWVLRSVCEQISEWNLQGFKDVRVAVNLSARQFETDIPRLVRRCLQETGIEARSLGLEITEGVAMKNVDKNIRMLDELHKLGLNISIDDFGTGYSSLAYLTRFPLNTLKIDRSFIVDITTNADDQAITRAIIALGRNLNLKVLAEGVETPGQVDILRESGCDYVQGYYYSKPIPADQVLPYVQERMIA